MEKKVDMFKVEEKYCGRTHRYTWSWEAEYDKMSLEELIANIAEPKILCYTGLDTIAYYDKNFIGSDSIKWLYENKCKETNTEKDIRECLLRCSVENVEWTKQRNEKLNGIFYRKITFLPEIQEMLKHKYQEYLDLLNGMIDEFQAQENEVKTTRKQRLSQWKLTKVYKKTIPSGREGGRDGYIDAEYENTYGITVRMVNRDVFDFGTYSYPKRFEGTDEALQYEAMTNEEKSLVKWLSEFGDFQGVRM